MYILVYSCIFLYILVVLLLYYKNSFVMIFKFIYLFNDSGNPDNPGSSSSPHTNSSTPNHTKPASDGNEGNIWLDQLINSVFPIDNSLSKTPPPNQDPIEAVSAEVVSILPHDGQSDTHSNGGGTRNHKRPLTIRDTSNGGQKRPRTDQSNSSVRLPDGVNLEQFLDQIHK